MKNYLLLFLLALATSIGFTSCDKDEETKPLTKTEMLTGKKWLLVAQTKTESDVPGVTDDTYSGLNDCTKDDLEIYTTDGKYISDEGATKCKDTDPQIFDEGTWAFSSDENKIIYTQFGFPGESEIVELTATRLVTRITHTDSQGVITVVNSTYDGI